MKVVQHRLGGKQQDRRQKQQAERDRETALVGIGSETPHHFSVLPLLHVVGFHYNTKRAACQRRSPRHEPDGGKGRQKRLPMPEGVQQSIEEQKSKSKRKEKGPIGKQERHRKRGAIRRKHSAVSVSGRTNIAPMTAGGIAKSGAVCYNKYIICIAPEACGPAAAPAFYAERPQACKTGSPQ